MLQFPKPALITALSCKEFGAAGLRLAGRKIHKTEVISHRAGAAVEYNARFLELAAHYGFRPRACRPRRARTKGKDERMVRYIKENFFARYRQFDSLAHLNQLAERWLREAADQRLHGTVKEVVAERFARELPLLHALPASRFDTAYHDGGWSHGMATSRCAATAIAYRANYAEHWLKCASDSAADWQSMIAKANWLRGIGSSPPRRAGCWRRSIIASYGSRP